MRFIDSSVFLYAFLKPRKTLTGKAREYKESAKRILLRVEEGEPVATTIVHVSEVANILEARLSLIDALSYVETILAKKNITVYGVDLDAYLEALRLARKHLIGVNDALAIVYMKMHGINEIYSFDTDFDKVKGIKRITS